MPSFLTAIPGAAWVRALLVAALLLGGSLVASGLMLALGLSTASTDEVPLGGKWFPLLIQLAAMGYGATVHGSLSGTASDLAGFDVSIFAVPGAVLVFGVLAVWLVGRRIMGGIAAPSWQPRLALSVVGGLAFATVLTVLSAIARVRIESDDLAPGLAVFSNHSASVLGYVYQFLIATAVVYVAFLPAASFGAGYWRRTIRDVTVTVVEHLGSLALVLGIALAIVATVQSGEPKVLLFAPLLVPYLGMAALGLTHLVPLGLHDSVSSDSGSVVDDLADGLGARSVSVFADSMPGWVWPAALVIALVWILVMAMRWRTRRGLPGGLTADPLSWVLLPAGHLLAGLVVLVGSWFSLDVTLGLDEDWGGDNHAAISIHLAWWVFFALALVGALTEVVSRFVTPAMARSLPGPVVRALTLGVHQDPTTRSGAASAPGTPGAPLRDPQQPASKRAKRWWLTGLIAAVVIIVLAVAGTITYSMLSKRTFGPTKQAENYLQAIVDGKAEKAQKLAGAEVDNEQGVLLTDEVYSEAKNRPSAYSIGDVDYGEKDATVHATLTIDGKAAPIEIRLVHDGKQAVIFDDWKIADVPAYQVSVAAGPEKMKVNGVEVEFTGLSMAERTDPEGSTPEAKEYPVLPGDYTFSAPEASKYVSYGEDVTLTAGPDSAGAQEPVAFGPTYTDAVVEDATKQVKDRIKSCVGSTAEYPAKCKAAGWVWDEKKKQPFKMTSRSFQDTPQIVVGPADGFGAEDISQVSGDLTVELRAQIEVKYKYKWDKKDKKWSDSSRFFQLGRGEDYSSPTFPITIDGDELKVDMSSLDKKVDNHDSF